MNPWAVWHVLIDKDYGSITVFNSCLEDCRKKTFGTFDCTGTQTEVVCAVDGLNIGRLNVFNEHAADLVTKNVDMMGAIVIVLFADIGFVNGKP